MAFRTFRRPSHFNMDWSGLNRLVSATKMGGASPYKYGSALYQKIAIEMLAFWYNRAMILASGGIVDGTKWADLTKGTLRAKTRNPAIKSPGSIMIALDRLLSALNPKGHPRGQLVRVGPDGLTVGFSKARHSTHVTYAELAEYMQKGDRSRNRPPRPILVVPDRRTKNKIIGHIKDAIEKTGDMKHGNN